MTQPIDRAQGREPLTAAQQGLAAKVLGGIPYTFHRSEGFYCIPLESDMDARACGDCNLGTLRVVNELTGETVWEQ